MNTGQVGKYVSIILAVNLLDNTIYDAIKLQLFKKNTKFTK